MEKLESGHYYHIYNRGNNKQDIFFDSDNYDYFLKLLKRHLSPVSTFYAYCLIQNHFHLVLRINDDVEKPSQAFSNLMNAYTKSINKRYQRSGSLFQKPFKRIKILNENYLLNLIVYVNYNPSKHNLDVNFNNYKYSSYLNTINEVNEIVSSHEVISLFENVENFIYVHQSRKDFLEENNLSLE